MLSADLSCAFECKTLNEDAAQFAGVASTDDLDLQGDVIEPGAFDPIPVRVGGVPDVLLLRDHDRSHVIGGWTKIAQEGRQLRVEGELCLAVEKARETYALLKKGYLSGLSVGFMCGRDGVHWDERAGKRLIKKASLRECSIVAMPANPAARVTVVKGDIDELLDADLTEVAMRDGPEAALKALVALRKDASKPWGDVEYADPGYQEDGVHRYPLDVVSRIRSAWNYIHHARNQRPYTAEQVRRIMRRIVAAWKRKIDPAGPPGADDDKGEKRTIKANKETPLASAIAETRGLLELIEGTLAR